jgi:hypothetical protein
MPWHILAALRSHARRRRLDVAMARTMRRLGTMNGKRLGVAARISQPIDGSFALAVAMLAGLTMACGSTSCSPSSALGSACANAGGSCVLGSVLCAKEAASGAQDCNTNAPNPGGAFCCLEVEEAGMSSANDGGAMSVPDGSPSTRRLLTRRSRATVQAPPAIAPAKAAQSAEAANAGSLLRTPCGRHAPCLRECGGCRRNVPVFGEHDVQRHGPTRRVRLLR